MLGGGAKVHLPPEMACHFLKALRLGIDGSVNLHLGIYPRERKHVHIKFFSQRINFLPFIVDLIISLLMVYDMIIIEF